MERELRRERDTDASRAERVVEVEERLREAREDADGVDREVTIDLQPTDKISAPVVGARKALDACKLTCLVDGEEVTVSVPWPTDTEDSSEPLVRLCEANGVQVDRIGDIDAVTLVKIDGRGYGVYIPPGKSTTEITVVLPSGRELTRRRTPLRCHLEAGVARLALALTSTPLVDIESGHRAFAVNLSAAGWAYFAVSLLGGVSLMAANTSAATVASNPTGAIAALLVISMVVAVPIGIVGLVLCILGELNDARVET